MKDFFASLYEWFGWMPFYSTDMGDHLRGWDITCTDYIGMPWYVYIGYVMIIITTLIFVVQYYIIDSSRWNKKQHWWLFALLVFVLNFLIAFTITSNTVNAGDFCNQLNLIISDCIGFGLSNATWSFIYFVLITSFPFPKDVIRSRNGNCRNTTFWKP